MTAKLSYGYWSVATGTGGWMNDCDVASDWTLGGDGGGDVATRSIVHGDYLEIDLTAIGGDANVYCDGNPTDFSYTTYGKLRFRYKCGNAVVKARVEVAYTVGDNDVALTDTNSTEWTEVEFTLAGGGLAGSGIVSTIRLFATTAIGKVYYDFVQFYKGDFTIPNYREGGRIELNPREARFGIPGKDLDAHQNLGSESTPIILHCDLNQGVWKRSAATGHPVTDTIDGQVFWDIHHNRSGEPWQWFEDSDMGIKMKVTVQSAFNYNEFGRTLDLTLHEKSITSKSVELYTERWGI